MARESTGHHHSKWKCGAPHWTKDPGDPLAILKAPDQWDVKPTLQEKRNATHLGQEVMRRTLPYRSAVFTVRHGEVSTPRWSRHKIPYNHAVPHVFWKTNGTTFLVQYSTGRVSTKRSTEVSISTARSALRGGLVRHRVSLFIPQSDLPVGPDQ